jgi:nucleotide-binding universal stress UspA family protein
MNSILCAIDFSETADRAARAAAALARALGAQLEVLHVVELPPGLATGAMVRVAGTIREEAEEELAARLGALERYEVPVKGRVELGRAEQVIAAAVQRQRPALLVLGTRNRGTVGRTLFGSVAESCLRLASCPVLIVPQGSTSWLDYWKREGRPLHVTAGIDFSPASEAALQWLRQLREEVACDIDVVYLYWPIRESQRLGLPLLAAEEDGRGEIGQILERELRARVGDLPGSGALRVRARAIWNGELNPLVWEAETDGADLLVVGTSQGSGPSTALGVVRSAKTPVLCVPAAAEPAPAVRSREPLRHVAVFTDLSELGDSAVDEAAWLLRGSGLLTICHVSPPEAPGSTESDRARIEGRLRGLRESVEKTGAIRVKTLIHENSNPAEGIVQAIRRIGPDVVVVASHGRSGVSRAVLGSVAETVVRHASAPVLVVPPADRRNPGF